jgi:hypothetical protein
MQAFMGRVIALEEEMDRAGAFEFGARCTVRTLPPWCEVGTGLDKVTTDGPFVEAKEHIGGFYMISADNLDEALAWAAKVVEAINHDIEVRPFRATGRLQDAPGTEAVVDGRAKYKIKAAHIPYRVPDETSCRIVCVRCSRCCT